MFGKKKNDVELLKEIFDRNDFTMDIKVENMEGADIDNISIHTLKLGYTERCIVFGNEWDVDCTDKIKMKFIGNRKKEDTE